MDKLFKSQHSKLYLKKIKNKYFLLTLYKANGGVGLFGRTPASENNDIMPAESLSRARQPIRIQTNTSPPKNTPTRVMMVPAITILCIPSALSSVAASEVCVPS